MLDPDFSIYIYIYNYSSTSLHPVYSAEIAELSEYEVFLQVPVIEGYKNNLPLVC